MGKRIIILGLAALMLSIGSAVFGQNMVTLDQAISYGVNEIESRLPQGIIVAVLNFVSPSQRLSNYVLDEMISGLVRNGKLAVVDRENSEFVLRELNYLRSGIIGDDSARSIGRLLGAQYIVSGSIEESSSNYVVQFKNMPVEPAALQTLIRVDVRKDAQTADLLGTSTFTQTRTGASAQTRTGTSTQTGTGTSGENSTLVLSTGGGGYVRFDLLHMSFLGLRDDSSSFSLGASLFFNAEIFKYLLVDVSPYYLHGFDHYYGETDYDGFGAVFSLFGQYPIQLTDSIRLSPLLGIGYDMLFYAKPKGSPAMTRKDLSNDNDFLYLKPGVKLNYSLIENLSLDARFIWDFMLYNKLFSEAGSGATVIQHAPSLFLGVSYSFLKI